MFLDKFIIDLGCGEGKLASAFYNHKEKKYNIFKKFFSYDLVSTKPFIKVCDISKLPLKNNSVDTAVFCLSLMGTNFGMFLQEANRVLKEKGILIITEVYSRFTNKKKFLDNLKKLGYRIKK